MPQMRLTSSLSDHAAGVVGTATLGVTERLLIGGCGGGEGGEGSDELEGVHLARLGEGELVGV